MADLLGIHEPEFVPLHKVFFLQRNLINFTAEQHEPSGRRRVFFLLKSWQTFLEDGPDEMFRTLTRT